VPLSARLLRDRKYFFGRRAGFLYEVMGRLFGKATDWRFMNYGYAPEAPDKGISLLPEDEFERYSAQLYHLVASQSDLTGKDVLDVGSGRGGGASLVHRYLGPRSTTGMDLAQSAVDFCSRVYSGIDGLEYKVGNSMDMPFKDTTFDAVINVESAHCYPDKNAFFAEVLRVLKPGGSFLYTDFTPANEKPAPGLTEAGFVSVEHQNITPGVISALELDTERREAMIRARVPFGLRRLFGLWAGTRGSWIYKDFLDGQRDYVAYRAFKPE
jgi:SAM-dependent methyltransferase